MKLPSEEEAERLTPVMEKMKRYLEEAAMELEKIYGSENIKYVIPSFYIPIIRWEEQYGLGNSLGGTIWLGKKNG